jgi:hypothetical protein
VLFRQRGDVVIFHLNNEVYDLSSAYFFDRYVTAREKIRVTQHLAARLLFVAQNHVQHVGCAGRHAQPQDACKGFVTRSSLSHPCCYRDAGQEAERAEANAVSFIKTSKQRRSF